MKEELEALMSETPVTHKGTEQFKSRHAKEFWFITHNVIRCPNCKKDTKMSYIHCSECGFKWELPNPQFEQLLRKMMYQ